MPGVLYVVATPIGNLADASERCLEALRGADLIACEDTRVTRTLLARYGVQTPTVSLHEHNEREASAGLLERLHAGGTVALVSDAGTPALSDPGAYLVAAAHAAGIRVSPIPGPSAAAAGLSVAGLPAAQFHFAGFLPASAAGRRAALQPLDLPVPVVLFEAPHRIAHTVEALLERFGGEREIVLGRELSKKFEEVARMRLSEAAAWLEGAPHRRQGEFVVVIGPGRSQPPRPAPDPDQVLALLLDALPPGEAARIAARITGESKNALYRKALAGRERKRK
jgi:16S rRNA (cytidine1402-2'-O)-methyltransferase